MAIICSGFALPVSPALGAFHQKPNSGVSREVVEGAEERPVESHQKWGGAKRHQGQGVGLQGCETIIL